MTHSLLIKKANIMLEWTRQDVCGEEVGVLIVDQTVWWAPEWIWRWEVSETAKKANKKYNKQNIWLQSIPYNIKLE